MSCAITRGYTCLACSAPAGAECREERDPNPPPVAVGRCWDCHCPMVKPVHRLGTDQLVCEDCADYAMRPWGCKNYEGQPKS